MSKLSKKNLNQFNKDIPLLNLIVNNSEKDIYYLLSICDDKTFSNLYNYLFNIRYNNTLLNEENKNLIRNFTPMQKKEIDLILEEKSLNKIKILFKNNITLLKSICQIILPILSKLCQK